MQPDALSAGVRGEAWSMTKGGMGAGSQTLAPKHSDAETWFWRWFISEDTPQAVCLLSEKDYCG